ncbi:MFS transporter [Cohnella panacarvi]|uniref:MFS transporter n=1 Tax=Cohnella panacarvi TaxID=400776 RepID=UPI00047E3DC0|nr:MFS transporter [Cohnella panacarvi]
MEISRIFRIRKNDSPLRKGMRISVYEGLPAVIFMNFLSGPFLTGYLLYLGATSQQIGIVLAVPALANLVQIAMAVISQKLENRKAALMIFFVIHRVVAISTGLIPFLFPEKLWVVIYIIVYCIAYISLSAGSLFLSSLFSDMVPSKVRGRFFGIRNTIHGGLTSLFLFVGGAVLEKYPGGTGFNILYIVSAIMVVVNLVLLALYPNPKFEKSNENNMGLILLKPFRDRLFLNAMLFLSLWMLLQGIALPFFSYVMLNLMHISYQWVSIVTIIQTVCSMIGFVIWGNLNMKYSNKKLLFWTLPIIALCCLVWGTLAFLPAILVLIVAHMLLGFGIGGFNQLVFNFVIGDTPKAERPIYIAVFSGITGLAGFGGPMLGGYIFDILKDAEKWVQSYGVFVATGIVLLVLAFTAGLAVLRDKPIRPL